MARLHHVINARKANKEHGIKKGDSYYWWVFRFGVKRISKTRPRRSQLTQSEFLSCVYDAEDDLADLASQLRNDYVSISDAVSTLEEAKSNLESQGGECDDKFNNMPDGLQQGDTGQLLEARVSFCSEISDSIDNIDTSDAIALEEEIAKLKEALDKMKRKNPAKVELLEEKEKKLSQEKERIAEEIGGLDWNYE